MGNFTQVDTTSTKIWVKLLLLFENALNSSMRLSNWKFEPFPRPAHTLTPPSINTHNRMSVQKRPFQICGMSGGRVPEEHTIVFLKSCSPGHLNSWQCSFIGFPFCCFCDKSWFVAFPVFVEFAVLLNFQFCRISTFVEFPVLFNFQFCWISSFPVLLNFQLCCFDEFPAFSVSKKMTDMCYAADQVL